MKKQDLEILHIFKVEKFHLSRTSLKKMHTTPRCAVRSQRDAEAKMMHIVAVVAVTVQLTGIQFSACRCIIIVVL